MRSYEERAKDFLKRVYPIISQYLTDPFKVEDCMDKFNEKYNRDVVVCWGSARVALITSDYVIKWEYDTEEVDSIGGFEDELDLYEKAKKDGFAYLFAEITPFEYKDFPFYIMPRIERMDNEYGDYDTAWDCMTREESDWCREHHLQDLHEGNFGERNGHICIFDYGFVGRC